MPNSAVQQSLLSDVIFPIAIATPFAVGDVFCYLIKDEKNILVDCGHHSNDSYRQLQSSLQEQDIAISDLDEIWLTHGHPDHFGQAARLADESGAVVKGHPKERANFANEDAGELFRAFFTAHGIPSPLIQKMLEQLEWLQQFQRPIEPQWVEDGAVLSSGQLSFTVKLTPGHAPGHVVYYSDEGLIFGGDVLLGHISTNALINFDAKTGKRNQSLLQYQATLQWMKKQQGRVLPGHGKQITKVGQVAAHHLSEQNKRYVQIKEQLQGAPQGLMELSQTLFPDALERKEHFLVFSELIGFLDWGKQQGVIKEEDTAESVIFSLV
jgi:glyoxylase-like metal-dependent hydrolase (beta-lactamase superfamily II)